MANPNVDALAAELAKVTERWFDRWQKAVAAARVANYPYQQFAADVTETWIDGTYAGLYPWSLLGPIQVTLQPAQPPTLRFVVDAAKADASRIVAVAHTPGATGVVAENLNDAAANTIPNAHVEVHLAQNDYVLVKLKSLGVVPGPPPAGLYTGNVKAQPMNVPILRVEVEWPG